MNTLFVSGIGTGVGKTLVSAILAEALQADYWKPVQAGYGDGTDSHWVAGRITNPFTKIHAETYRLQLAASPHIAAREEGLRLDTEAILSGHKAISSGKHTLLHHAVEHKFTQRAGDRLAGINEWLVVEGAGGVLVPLNEKEFVIDLMKAMGARVILVSRNYLGSINHSLLTASHCRAAGIPVMGWIFNDQYMNYASEIETWSGYPAIASIPYQANPDQDFVLNQANRIRPGLLRRLA